MLLGEFEPGLLVGFDHMDEATGEMLTYVAVVIGSTYEHNVVKVLHSGKVCHWHVSRFFKIDDDDLDPRWYGSYASAHV